MFLQHFISVLFQEAINLVLDVVGKVQNNEGCLGHARLFKVFGFGMLVIHLLAPVLIRAPRHAALFVQEVQQTQFTLYQINAWLVVIEINE